MNTNFGILQYDKITQPLYDTALKVEKACVTTEVNAYVDNYLAIYLRGCIEAILKSVKQLDNGSDLNSKINLLKEKWPGCWIIKSLNNIRSHGNNAAHQIEYELKRKEAIELLEDFHNVIIWYIEDYKHEDIDIPKFDIEAYENETLNASKEPNTDSRLDLSIQANKEGFFTNEQEKVIFATRGNHVVIAAPGTGKTYTMTKRLSQLLKDSEPKDLLSLTFSKRAAIEMRDRASKEIGESNVFIGNIHAFCFQYLTEHINQIPGLSPNFNILDPSMEFEVHDKSMYSLLSNSPENPTAINLFKLIYDKRFSGTKSLLDLHTNLQTRFIEHINNHLGTDNPEDRKYTDSGRKDLFYFFKSLNKTFLALNNCCHENKQYIEHLRDDWHEKIKKIYGLRISCFFDVDVDVVSVLALQYLMILTREKSFINAVTFDDLIGYTMSILSYRQDKFKHIQVDEVQDFDKYQWLIVGLLSDDEGSLCLFGDSEQSIYSFLGADASLLEENTPKFKKHLLSKNYRSNKYIVNFLKVYKTLILNDLNDSNLSPIETVDDERHLMLHQCKTLSQQFKIIATVVNKTLKETDRNIGILVRFNKEVEEVSDLLSDNSIRNFKVGSNDFLKSDVYSDFLSFLRVYRNEASRVDWYKLFRRFLNLTIKESMQLVDRLFNQCYSPYTLFNTTKDAGQTMLSRIIDAKSSGRVVIFDTETTSLEISNSELLQIAAVVIENGEVTHEFNKYLRLADDVINSPDFEDSSKIHHITKQQIQSGDEPATVIRDFIELIDQPKTLLVAHNISYDTSVLQRNIAKYGGGDEYLHRFIKKSTENSIDTLQLSRILFPKLPNYKLETLLAELSLEGVNSHDALDDVLATKSLFDACATKMESKWRDAQIFFESNKVQLSEFYGRLSKLVDILDSHSIAVDEKTQRFALVNYDYLINLWVEFCYENSFYTKYELKNFELEARDKLYPWIHRNIARDIFYRLINSPVINDLSMLTEPDLINPNIDRVTVSTIHRSKGLEFDTVIIPGLVDSKYPFINRNISFDEVNKRIDEDKRLLYVALSRATEKLVLISPQSGDRGLEVVSRFISPLLDHLDYHKVY